MSLDIKKVISHLLNQVEDHDAQLNQLTNTVLDTFYPVGSYYETSDSSFNPNTTWGGTWVLETAGIVHVSSGTGYEISGASSNSGAGIIDGGNKDAIIPSHTHTLTRTTNVTVAAHGITQPTFSMGNLWSDGTGSESAYVMSSNRKRVTRNCSRTTNVALTNNHTVTQPEFSAATVGEDITNANMQPYINVNRWHRTA